MNKKKCFISLSIWIKQHIELLSVVTAFIPAVKCLHTHKIFYLNFNSKDTGKRRPVHCHFPISVYVAPTGYKINIFIFPLFFFNPIGLSHFHIFLCCFKCPASFRQVHRKIDSKFRVLLMIGMLQDQANFQMFLMCCIKLLILSTRLVNAASIASNQSPNHSQLPNIHKFPFSQFVFTYCSRWKWK